MRWLVALVIVSSGRSTVSPSVNPWSACHTLPLLSVKPAPPALMRMGRATFGSVEVAVEAGAAGVEAAGVLVLMDEEVLEGLSDADWHPASNKAESDEIERQLNS